MSKIGYCERGGQDGILVGESELNELAAILDNGYLDKVMPLPRTSHASQLKKIEACEKKGEHGDEEYWERKNGSHGWCCLDCGTVTQWG